MLGYNMYAYCYNNPVNMSDPSGHWPKWIEVAVEWVEENVYEPVVIRIKTNTKAMYYGATKWHFEDRIAANGTHPSYSEVTTKGSEWNLLPESQSIYHDNGLGAAEYKFITDDGREAVFDGDTLEPVTDPQYIATYNYCPVYQYPDSGGNLWDVLKVAGSGIGHFFADMLPYYLTGNSNTREQFEDKIFIFD